MFNEGELLEMVVDTVNSKAFSKYIKGCLGVFGGGAKGSLEVVRAKRNAYKFSSDTLADLWVINLQSVNTSDAIVILSARVPSL